MLLYMCMRDSRVSVWRVERAMTAIRRSQSRRTLARIAGAPDPALFEVLDAVAQAEQDGAPVTVTTLAERLGIDQPRASRLVSRAVDRGLIRRAQDRVDARRLRLLPTAGGQTHLDQARATRQEFFARAMTDWSDAERETFAELLTRFVAGFEQTSGARFARESGAGRAESDQR